MAQPAPTTTSSPSLPVSGLPVVLPSWHDPVFIGPLLVGSLLQFGVFCILVTQAVVFFARQGHGLDDGRLFLLYVTTVLVFTTLEVATGVWRIYSICVLLRPWDHLPDAWFEAVLNSIVIESVHGFFIFRCYKLSRSKLVLGLVLVLMFGQIAAAIVTVKAVRFVQIRTTTLTVCSATVALDTVISITLFVNLWRQRTGQGDVDAVVLRIVRMTVESNVPCLISLIVVLVGSVKLGTAPLGSLFHLAIPVVSPLYANALLTTLNARPGLRRQFDSNRDNGRLSTQDSIQFRSSNRSQRTSHVNTRQFIDPTQRGRMSYDIAFTNAIELTNNSESRSDMISKTRLSVPDEDAIMDLCPEYPPTLSSRRGRNSRLVNEQTVVLDTNERS